MNKNKTAKTIILTAVIAILLSAVVFALLFFFGVLHFNNPNPNDFPIVGVDVSNYQGDIDWETLSAQNIDFAFMKATEGSSFVDPCFAKNWSDAAKANIRIGAYHFFSFESSGEQQAALFCDTVTSVDGMLPPVIDVEYYGVFKTKTDVNLPEIKDELRLIVDILTEKYGLKPILYCDEKTYADLIIDDFSDCDLWYRSVYSSVPSGIKWTFWQYSNRHVLKGYNGKERYIDMNVFAGTKEDFYSYP